MLKVLSERGMLKVETGRGVVVYIGVEGGCDKVGVTGIVSRGGRFKTREVFDD